MISQPLRSGALPATAAERKLRLVLRPAPQPEHSPLAYWHLLSLDAPTVAALWTLFLARCAGVQLPLVSPAAMFVAVWMLYAADRLLDARPVIAAAAPQTLEERHRFHQRHRNRFLPALCFAAVLCGWLLHELPAAALRLYAVLAALLSAWLLLVHTRPAAAHRLPKELAVAVFFPAAVFIPTVARAPALRLELLPSALLFAAACALNCLFLYAWEHPHDRTTAHWTTHWATRHLLALGALALATALLVLAFTSRADALRASPAAASALAIALLLLLHTLRSRFRPVTLRALADAALLTPLPLLVAMHWLRP